MATTSSRRRPRPPGKRSPKRKPSPGSSRAVQKSKQAAKSTAESTAQKTKRAAKSTALVARDSSGPSELLRKAAFKAAKAMTRRTLQSGAGAVQRAAEVTAESGMSAIDAKTLRRLPIQCSVDVAVPVRVAWEEWMKFASLPEGVHRVQQIERDGDGLLLGRTAGPRSADWQAEILDERDRQSFAWQSTKGSDCAGLVTFHELSERLTRIELNLDVVPTSIPEALTLSSHLADRHADADLRRFKARLELISPDVYENDEEDEDENDSEAPDGAA